MKTIDIELMIKYFDAWGAHFRSRFEDFDNHEDMHQMERDLAMADFFRGLANGDKLEWPDED